MSVIDCIDLFADIQKAVAVDRQLSKDYQIAFIELPEVGEVLYHGKMIAWLPEEE